MIRFIATDADDTQNQGSKLIFKFFIK